MLRTIMVKTSKRARKAVPVLSLVIPLAALISVVNVAISMSTCNWLDSYERIPISNTSIMEEFMIKRTVSGLWFLCSYNLSEKQFFHELNYNNITVTQDQMNCSTIEYFVKDRYISDPNDSTNAIRYAVTKAGPLFVMASILLGVAVIAAIFGYQRHRRIALFIAGIIFIVSGLMLLIGLVVYLSALQSEIGPKLRPKNAVDLPQFTYKYGYSFILVVVGFMATEMTGILAIFYYIYWHQLDWAQKLATNGNGNGSGSVNSGNGNGKGKYPGSEYRCGHHPRTHRIQDIYDLNSSSGNKRGHGHGHGQDKLPHHPSCNAYQLEKDKHGTSGGGESTCGSDFDIPFPPPPPPSTAYLSMTRDYPNSCSDEEGSILYPPQCPTPGPAGLGLNRDRKDRDRDQRNTPV